MKAQCSVCQVEVEESPALQGEEGLVCPSCRVEPGAADVNKVLGKDKRLGAFLVLLGMALLAAAGLMAGMRAEGAEAMLAKGGTFQGGTGSGVVLTAFVAGFAALAVGTVKIWRTR